MSVSSASPELLKRAVLELVEECRQHIAKGDLVDVSEVERGVRTYCEAISVLPAEEGRAYTRDLKMLMEVMAEFSSELVAARNLVHAELEALGRLRKASSAYQKSDAIAGIRKKNEEEQ